MGHARRQHHLQAQHDPEKDFAPIGLISINPQLLIGKKTLPADDLKGLVAWMKENPGKANYVNQNAAARVSGILLEQATGTKVSSCPTAAPVPP